MFYSNNLKGVFWSEGQNCHFAWFSGRGASVGIRACGQPKQEVQVWSSEGNDGNETFDVEVKDTLKVIRELKAMIFRNYEKLEIDLTMIWESEAVL